MQHAIVINNQHTFVDVSDMTPIDTEKAENPNRKTLKGKIWLRDITPMQQKINEGGKKT